MQDVPRSVGTPAGLLHEAMAMFASNNSEITWCDDTPGCISDSDCGDDDLDDDGDGTRAIIPRSP